MFLSIFARPQVQLAVVALPAALGMILFGVRSLAPNYAVVITPPVTDVGDIKQGERRTVTVMIQNRSDRIITVVPSARSSCSCVKAVGSPVDLIPGEERPFDVRVDTTSVPGQWERQALFQINGLVDGEILGISTIKANVLPEYTLAPSEIQATPGKTIAVTITPGFKSNIRIKDAFSPLSHIHCKVAQDGSKVEILFDPVPNGSESKDPAYLIVTTTSELQPSNRVYIHF